MVAQREPPERAFVGALLHARREPQALFGEGFNRGPGRTGAGEGGEQVGHRISHPLVGVQHHPARRVVHEPNRQGHVQLSLAGLGQLAAT